MTRAWAALILVGIAGCSHDEPPPPRAPIPPVGTYTQVPPPPPKPLPGPDPSMTNGGQPFMDDPLVKQPTPEQPAFVATYDHVGRPRIAVFVNRTLTGQIVPTRAENGQPQPAYSPTDADARIDYDAIESVLTDNLSAGGHVAIVSPKLLEGQARQLEQGKASVLQELANTGQIDVLVQLQATVTRQTPQGPSFRWVAEAMNTRDGESLARAVVDVPPPLDKPAINDYARFLARRLMSGMTETWQSPAPANNAPPPNPPTPQTAPTTPMIPQVIPTTQPTP